MENFIAQILSALDDVISHLVKDGYNHVALIISPLLIALLTLSILFFSYKLLMGSIKNKEDWFVFLGKMVFVVVMVSGWGEITDLFYDVFVNMTGWLGNAIVNATSGSLGIGKGAHSVDDLALALQEVMEFSEQLAVQIMHFTVNPMKIIEGVLVFLGGFVTVALGLCEIIYARLSLAFFFVLLPLMSTFVLFEKTKRFFETYLGLMCGSALMLIFVPSMLGFCVSFQEWTLEHWGVIQFSGDTFTIMDISSWATIIPFLLMSVATIVLVLKAAEWAQQIGAGFSSGTGSGAMSAAIAGIGLSYARTKSGVKGTAMAPVNAGKAGVATYKAHQATKAWAENIGAKIRSTMNRAPK